MLSSFSVCQPGGERRRHQEPCSLTQPPPNTIFSQRTTSMQNLLSGIKKFVWEEEGATMVEYALMLSLIAIVSIAAVALIGKNAKTLFNNIAGSITGS